MTGTALIPHPAPADELYRFDVARIYAATQSRRTAPAWAPRKGRIIDLAG